MSTLSNISPVDGRYAAQVDDLRDIFSESGLIRLRVQTEVAWLKKLTLCKELPELEPNTRILSHLESLVENWCEEFSLAIKEIEQGTNHDVKAIEYWLKEQLLRFSEDETKVYREFIHFACTSEDINNVAYALMLKQARDHVILPEMNKIVSWLKQHARAFAEMPMMSRTHGQPASPTTMGKELAIFASRLSRQIRQLEEIPILAKINGAVGNFNAHLVAYPQIDWLNLSRELIEELGLDFNKYTTQIESHDYIAEICDVMVRFNHILLDLDRDLWSYISLGYFKQLRFQGEVGSSTMPHKINPISFENSEGNLGVANSLFRHFSSKLVISRMQRDLSDSTVLRSLGVALAHSLIAFRATLSGFARIDVDQEGMLRDLDQAWELLAEPIQTVLRKYQVENAYEKLKDLTRGEKVTRVNIVSFIDSLDEIPQEAKESLMQLTPASYVGVAPRLAREI